MPSLEELIVELNKNGYGICLEQKFPDIWTVGFGKLKKEILEENWCYTQDYAVYVYDLPRIPCQGLNSVRNVIEEFLATLPKGG